MYHSEQINELSAALSKAQGEFESPQKRSKAYNYKYADLAEIMECIKDPLAKHGLSIVNQMEMTEAPFLTATLLHSSGQWMKSSVPLFFQQTDKVNQMQAMGSAITYARRYAISCLLNLAADKESDDDGASSGSPAPSYSSRPQPPTTTWNARMVRKPEGSSV